LVSVANQPRGNLLSLLHNLGDCFVVCEQVYKAPRNEEGE